MPPVFLFSSQKQYTSFFLEMQEESLHKNWIFIKFLHKNKNSLHIMQKYCILMRAKEKG